MFNCLVEDELKTLNHYKEILSTNPRSKAFAPLAEQYRKMGELNKALEIASEGVLLHPNYHGGKVALAQILIDLNKTNKALDILQSVTEHDVENILAFKLIAKCHLIQNEHQKACEYYEKVLKVNAEDKLSVKMIEKLKPAPHTEETAKTESLSQAQNENKKTSPDLTLIDALIEQSKFSSAREKLTGLLHKNSNDGEALKRLAYINSLIKTKAHINRQEVFSKPEVNIFKIKTLTKALEKIEKEIKANDTNI